MTQIVEAVYDGTVLRPEAALRLEPNTRVRLTLEVVEPPPPASSSFLQTARALKLSGPRDWSENHDKYLYGEGDHTAD